LSEQRSEQRRERPRPRPRPAEPGAGHVRRHLSEIRGVAYVPAGPARRRWWRDWSWLVLLALALTAYWLATFFGPGSFQENALDALKLFPSGFPGSEGRWELLLAKHLAAVVGLFLTARLLVVVFAERWHQLKARLRSNHAVVCGLGEKGLRSTLAFRTGGHKVTCIDIEASDTAANAARDHGAIVLKGDATQLVSLAAARVDRADHLVAACGNDAVNARIAVLGAQLAGARAGARLNIYAHIGNPELAHLLRAPALGLRTARLHFFNIHRVWARALLDHATSPLAAPHGLGSRPATVVVLGLSELASAVVLGAARRWHRNVRSNASSDKLRLVVVDPTAPAALSELADRYPAIRRVCDLEPISETPSVIKPPELSRFVSPDRACAIYVCLQDHGVGLALALQIERQIADPSVPILAPAVAVVAEISPLLAGGSRVRTISLGLDPESLDLLHDSMREALARASHEIYIRTRSKEADFGSRPADRPWEELSEEDRRSSRHQVDGMIDQLHAVWYQIAPRYDWDEEVKAIEPALVEAMSELEHVRWAAHKRAEGYTYGPVEQDRKRKLHPLLVPYSELSEAEKDLDRNLVRERPRTLALADYRLERSSAREALARLLHERYVAGRVAAGDPAPNAVDWDRLGEELREDNRRHVDDFAVKLIRIGCRIAPADGRQPATRLTEAEFEELARMEHDRWRTDRLASGWTLGARDEAGRKHPGLVPWSELPEAVRDIDRELVRALPELLAEVGSVIARVEPPARGAWGRRHRAA
jgi:voltage-gated potassium channel Kch